MAIDLNFQAAPVSQFAKEDPATAAAPYLTVGRGVSTILGTAKEISDEWLALKDEREVRQTSLELGDIKNYRETYYGNQFYYDGEELEGTGFPGQRYEKGPEGDQKSKAIPSWQAEPYVRRRDSLKDLENAAAGISNYELRQKYLAAGTEQIQKTFDADIRNSLIEGRNQTRAEVATELSELMRKREHDAALDVVDSTNVFTDSEKTDWRQRISIDAEFQTVQTLVAKPTWTINDFEQAAEQIEYLGTDTETEYQGPLDLEQRIMLQNQLRAKAALETEKAKVRKANEDTAWIMETLERVRNGDPDVDASYLLRGVEEGRLTSSRAISIWSDILKRYEEKLKNNQAKEGIIISVKEGLGYAPTTKNRAIVDQIYADNVTELRELRESDGQEYTIQDFQMQLSQHVRQFDTVPTRVQDHLRGLNRSNPPEIVMGANIYRMIKSMSPDAIRDLQGDDFDVIRNTASAMELGLDEATAVKSALRIRDDDPITQEAINKIWADATLSKSGMSLIDNWFRERIEEDEDFGAGFIFDADIPVKPAIGFAETADGLPEEMEMDFLRTFRTLLQATNGNVSIARNQAYDLIKTRWKLTDINYPTDIDSDVLGIDKFSKTSGKTIMAFPPDSMPGHDPNILGSHIRNDVNQKYRDLLKPGEHLEITSDFQTLEQGRQGLTTTYPVYAVDDEGTPRLLMPRWTYNKLDIRKNREKVEKALRDANYDKKVKEQLKEVKRVERAIEIDVGVSP